MTGKEALKQLEERYHKYIIEWYYMSNMSKEERSRLFYMYDEEIKIIDKELDKYKMAFEILKEVLSLEKDTSLDEKVDFHTLYFTGELPYECYKRLTKEQYELLEELMKDD